MPDYTDNIKNMPYGPLGIIALPGTEELAQRIDRNIVAWRRERENQYRDNLAFSKYERDTYIVETDIVRFGTGEGKAVIKESIRGYDLYILIDPFNHGATYTVRFGGVKTELPIMPDEHYMNLKRVISAVGGKARRISVIMPMLYCGRQHKRHGRESLDCAMALQDLCEEMGVENIITFEAHDGRVQNAIPLNGFENLTTTYQMVKALYYWDAQRDFNMQFDREHMMIVSPDEGGMFRAVNYSGDLSLTLGTFYKERDPEEFEEGHNKIKRHEFLGGNVEGKDVIVVDDMISSGDSALEVARQLRALHPKRIFFCVAFGLFCNGLQEFDKAYEEGVFDCIFCTNLVYRTPELLSREWFCEVNLCKYISLLVDSLNHNISISAILNHKQKIDSFLIKRGKKVDPETGEYRLPDPQTGKFIDTDPKTGKRVVLDPDLVIGCKKKHN